MPFDHMLVTRVEFMHARRVQQMDEAIETTNADRAEVLSSVRSIVDGVPVSKQLALFCQAIRASHRTIKFAVANRPKIEYTHGVSVISEIWAYFPGDQYCPVRLGWGDYSVNTRTSNKYCVYSRHIKNEKYGDDKEQYHMSLADSVERAMKNFKKFLRPYTPADVALMSIANFQSKLGAPAWQASSAYNEAYEAVCKHGSFHNELRSLVLNDYQFNDPAFGGLVKDMLTKLDEQMTKQYEAHHGYYVQVREYMGNQVFDVIAVLDVKKASSRHVGAHRTYTGEQLAEFDENLPSRLAALSMLENDAFVEGLGHKVSPTAYWVLK